MRICVCVSQSLWHLPVTLLEVLSLILCPVPGALPAGGPLGPRYSPSLASKAQPGRAGWPSTLERQGSELAAVQKSLKTAAEIPSK